MPNSYDLKLGVSICTDDKLVEAFSITGTPDEVRDKLKRFESHLDHVILHTPYIPPLTPAETEDAFRQIVSAFGADAFGPSAAGLVAGGSTT